MKKRVLACAAIVLAASTTFASAKSPVAAVFLLSGTVSSSTAGGSATCPVADTVLGGVAYFPGFKKSGFVITVAQSGSTSAILYVFPKIASLTASGNLSYVLPPLTSTLSGTFNLTNGSTGAKTISFTLETQTGSLGNGTGTCDTFYDMTLTQGIPKALKGIF